MDKAGGDLLHRITVNNVLVSIHCVSTEATYTYTIPDPVNPLTSAGFENANYGGHILMTYQFSITPVS